MSLISALDYVFIVVKVPVPGTSIRRTYLPGPADRSFFPRHLDDGWR